MSDNPQFTFIIISVVMSLALCLAILVIVDHKAKIPGQMEGDPFSISGMREDHPYIAFLTAAILFVIIFSLLFELTVALITPLGVFTEKPQPKLLQALGEQRVTEKLRHFHNNPVADYPNLGSKTVCFYCHGDFPHSKEPMVRTLLNMHTQFIGCSTCHNDPRKVEEESLTFAWVNFTGIEVVGPPFGTAIQPETGDLIETDDYYSKIVAYTNQNGSNVLLEIPETNPEVIEFIEIREDLTDQDREALKKKFHQLVSPKGRFCSRCHVEESRSYLPFRKLGFSDQRVTDITNMNMIGITQKYRRFYMPDLFSRDASLPDADILLGPDREMTNETDEAGEDPGTWWRRTFDQAEERRNAPER